MTLVYPEFSDDYQCDDERSIRASGLGRRRRGGQEWGRNRADNETEVFAVHGADPEVLAYAMAKYSRSSLSMKESLREISSQRAEQFLNTFYFQYGHRSIADLAHVAFAIERLSLLAAIVLVDEQRWDGQERSTRYQNFGKKSDESEIGIRRSLRMRRRGRSIRRRLRLCLPSITRLRGRCWSISRASRRSRRR